MSILILLLVGGALGWVASLLKPTSPRGVLTNAVAGMLGALLGGWLLAPVFGSDVFSANAFSVGSLLKAALGAVILIVVAHLVRKGMHMDDADRDR